MSMTYLTTLLDQVFGNTPSIGYWGELLVAERTILLGKTPESPLDLNVWQSGSVSGGYLSSSGRFILGTSNSSGSVYLSSSNRAIMQAGTVNVASIGTLLNNTGSAGNVRTWGVYTKDSGGDGLFWELSGVGVVNIVNRIAGVDTRINIFSGGINTNGSGYVLDTNPHIHQIYYAQGGCFFVQDKKLVYSFFSNQATIGNNIHFKLTAENRNTNSGIDNTLIIPGLAVHRQGQASIRASYSNINSNGTFSIKIGPGTLFGYTVNTDPNNGSTITIYDSNTGSGKTIATILGSAVQGASGVNFGTNGIDFNEGLTVVVSGLTSGDFTFTYA